MKKILSLGAGVQSTTVLLMSCHGELERLDAAVFADTGWEPPAVYEHLEKLKAESERHGIPVHVVSCGRNIREDAVSARVRGLKMDGERYASLPWHTKDRETGSHGMVRRQCTREYKADPCDKFIRQWAGIKQRQKDCTVEQWFGISLDEIRRMRLSKYKWDVHYYPLVDVKMTRNDCRQWLNRHGWTAVPRSACVGCPFRTDMEWREMKLNHPEVWADAVEFDNAIRKAGGMRGDTFTHRSCKPLDEVDLTIPEDHGQLTLFCDSGYCGV